jgi:predicted helicase
VVLNTNGGEIRLQAFEESKRLKKNATNKIEVFGTLNASSKQQSSSAFRHIFLSKNIQESCLISLQTKEGGYTFPLYLNPENKNQQTIYQSEVRTPNLNSEIVKQIADNLGLTFTNEKETTKDTFAPIDILDYIYAVLHSPTYREKYKEFLKIDFPRVPYPKDKDSFWKLVKLGREIREIHLLESPTVEKYITQYPIDGDNVVVKPKYQDNKVYINDTQYFNNVPQIAWEFYIGGYQPAQKWLKDRKDRKLEFDDILHYQKIVVALTETDRLMKEIDKIEIL